MPHSRYSSIIKGLHFAEIASTITYIDILHSGYTNCCEELRAYYLNLHGSCKRLSHCQKSMRHQKRIL
ncbi:MAG TPA: hypothetical protein DCZ91_04170 [Lachnospiraceae bacterium]|nr:hypothetical protein [Lachnospiraceae bacterium]